MITQKRWMQCSVLELRLSRPVKALKKLLRRHLKFAINSVATLFCTIALSDPLFGSTVCPFFHLKSLLIIENRATRINQVGYFNLFTFILWRHARIWCHCKFFEKLSTENLWFFPFYLTNIFFSRKFFHTLQLFNFWNHFFLNRWRFSPYSIYTYYDCWSPVW